jgi:hypothetical protein
MEALLYHRRSGSVKIPTRSFPFWGGKFFGVTVVFNKNVEKFVEKGPTRTVSFHAANT